MKINSSSIIKALIIPIENRTISILEQILIILFTKHFALIIAKGSPRTEVIKIVPACTNIIIVASITSSLVSNTGF